MSAHFYNKQGELVPGWTKGAYPSPSTILDLIAAPEIENWRRRYDEIWGEGAAERLMTERQERGTRVHKACELISRDDQNWDKELEVTDMAFVDGFIRWREKYRPDVIATEIFLTSEKYKYAGTADLIVTIDGIPWLIDLKTGADRTKHGLQLKFYQQAYYEMTGTRCRMGVLALDAKRSCGYRNSRSPFGLKEYKTPLWAMLAHRAAFRFWHEAEPIKQPIDGSLIWKAE